MSVVFSFRPAESGIAVSSEFRADQDGYYQVLVDHAVNARLPSWEVRGPSGSWRAGSFVGQMPGMGDVGFTTPNPTALGSATVTGDYPMRYELMLFMATGDRLLTYDASIVRAAYLGGERVDSRVVI